MKTNKETLLTLGALLAAVQGVACMAHHATQNDEQTVQQGDEAKQSDQGLSSRKMGCW